MSDPTALTLRFKHGKLTALMLATPLTPFTQIISELLASLKERYPAGLDSKHSQNYISIPEKTMNVILGVPKDPFDLTKGWDELDIGGTGIAENPRSLGLKEGAVIAFSFVPEDGFSSMEDKFYVETPNVDELYPEDE